jgi:hypothetical protein
MIYGGLLVQLEMSDLLKIGLCGSSRRPGSLHRRPALDPIHNPHTAHLHLGYFDPFLVDCAFWYLWECKL